VEAVRILYIFPHPDDESFGPAAAIWSQKKKGYEVHLFTLTKGGATKVRHKLGLSVEEMGDVRHKEMIEVAKVLHLDSFHILDMPDSGLADLDPRIIEEAIRQHLLLVKPDIIVSYPVHGISGFPDHLVTHAVVKRVYCQLRDEGNHWLRRFAMFTISQEQQKGFEASVIPVKSTPDHQIHVRIPVSKDDNMAMDKALNCYVTYKETIEKTMKTAPPFKEIVFQLFDETPDRTLSDITEGL
jgi:LmbE family N-acetylglucosaminyl deacetylase